jgi:hypothetical protein
VGVTLASVVTVGAVECWVRGQGQLRLSRRSVLLLWCAVHEATGSGVEAYGRRPRRGPSPIQRQKKVVNFVDV